MHHDYADILDAAGADREPRWWDENGVPRFCDFHPQASGYIYASEAVLLGITCQGCGHPFRVCMTQGDMSYSWWPLEKPPYEDGVRCVFKKWPTLAERVEAGEIEYGDPPNVGCCAAGPTMSSVPRRVLEFWRRGSGEWKRVPWLERAIECDWVIE